MEHYFSSYQTRQLSLTLAQLKDRIPVDQFDTIVEYLADTLELNSKKFDRKKWINQCRAKPEPILIPATITTNESGFESLMFEGLG